MDETTATTDQMSEDHRRSLPLEKLTKVMPEPAEPDEPENTATGPMPTITSLRPQDRLSLLDQKPALGHGISKQRMIVILKGAEALLMGLALFAFYFKKSSIHRFQKMMQVRKLNVCLVGIKFLININFKDESIMI